MNKALWRLILGQSPSGTWNISRVSSVCLVLFSPTKMQRNTVTFMVEGIIYQHPSP